MHLHEFLREIHAILKPQVYLEVGVQYGTSLALAEHSTVAIGVDPNPLIWGSPHSRDNQELYAIESDDFFTQMSEHVPRVNLGFIDGLHLFEQALKDFINLEKVMAEDGVIIIDDVLPYNQAIAERKQPAGDWTGDVWKVVPLLRSYRTDLKFSLIDTAPTGVLMVAGFSQPPPAQEWMAQQSVWFQSDEVPLYILERHGAHQPREFLEGLRP